MAADCPRRSDTNPSPLLPSAAELPIQVGLLLAGPGDPGDPTGQRLSFLHPRSKEVPEEGHIGADSDEVLAEVCENRHRQNSVGGEVEEVEVVGVHDVAEEL